MAPEGALARARLSRWAVPCGLAVAGLLQAWSLAWPFETVFTPGQPVPTLQLLALAVCLALVNGAPAARAAFWRGGWFATVWLAATFWWLYVSMHTYGGMPAVLAALAVVALAAALALYYGLACAVAWRWRAQPLYRQALAWASLWTLAEWARGTWFTGFPWGAVGYAHVDSLSWWTPYVGVYGMGAGAVAASAVLARVWAVWRDPLRARAGWAAWGSAGLIGFVLSPPVGSGLAEALPDHTRSTGRLPVALLQGNIPQNEKFQADAGIPLALNWYGAQIRAAVVSLPQGGLVVAPETAIPLLPQDVDADYWAGLRTAVAQGGAAAMLGLPLGSWTDGYTNSVVTWTPDGTEHRYDKHHLVPFGEFIPWGFRWFVDLMQMPLGDFRRGELGQAPVAWAGQRIAPNVCYEDLFGEELAASFRAPARAPTVLVNVSNIAWFGDTVAIDQHRHISRVRAMELRRPMLRATNTGATAIIDHRGRVVQELPRLTREVLIGQVEGRDGLTPYARWAGAWGVWPLVLACLAVLWLVRPRPRV